MYYFEFSLALRMERPQHMGTSLLCRVVSHFHKTLRTNMVELQRGKYYLLVFERLNKKSFFFFTEHEWSCN